jgi:hypothetical protein
LRDLSGLGIRDLKALDGPAGSPEGIELGVARREDGPSVLVVASVRDGLDLPGWGEVAASLADERARRGEVLIAAPLLSERTRRAAQRVSLSGRLLCLVVVPGLADPDAELLDQETFPRSSRLQGWADPPTSVLDRVLSVIGGATSVACCGQLRAHQNAFLLYMRGACVLRVYPEGDGVAVNCMAPETKLIHVTESNFARWGVEIHETVVQLAQDPRLLEGEAANRERAIERAAAASGARVTARWLPWNPDGVAPIEWVGVDADKRPVLGVIRTSLTLANGPGLLAAMHVLEEERERWAPGSLGVPRLRIASDQVDSKLSLLLAGLDLQVGPLAALLEGDETGPRESERRSRKRPRRRRRGRTEDEGWQRGEAAEATEETQAADPASVDAAAADEVREEEVDRRPSFRRGRSRRDAARSSTWVEDSAEDKGSGEDNEEAALTQSEEVPETAADLPETASAAGPPDDEPGPEPADDARAPQQQSAELGPEAELPDSAEISDPVEIEIEATLAEEPGETEEAESEPIEVEPRRSHNARAAIVVQNDPGCVLAALILARERRNIVSFRVVPQDGLMDFFKGPATDLADNVDLLLVGFTAQPTPLEVIQTAEIFRGRIQWFDHHDWPIEDVERLRDAIGRDAIAFESGASSPLAPISKITERRSRFTDKLIDLAGGRLSENDMAKWGYRVVGLLNRVASEVGEQRSAITPILSGKPAECASADADTVYAAEAAWLVEHDPRVVHFGEYQMVVLRVPPHLDAGEVGRRSRLSTGARLSLISRENDDLLVLGCNEEKRHINILGLVDHVSAQLPWAAAAPGGDRVGRLRIEHLSSHPERMETLVGEIIRHRSILYG